MLGYMLPHKKDLKAMVGRKFHPLETSAFGEEYGGRDGEYSVVGPDPYTRREWYARVSVKAGIIVKVR